MMLIHQKIKELPLELRLHILMYTLPRVDDLTKRAIKVTSIHHSILRANKKWCVLINMDWQEFLSQYYTENDLIEIYNALSDCGCCIRHSKGLFNNMVHCNNVGGSFTRNKFNKRNVMGWDNKKCSCWCRHQLRHVIRILELIR